LQLLTEQEGVDEIRLYLAKKYARFPDYDGTLPKVPDSVKIFHVERDYGPATKILPALNDFQGRDAQILFCDDDVTYAKGWAKRLFDIQSSRPSEAVATRGSSIDWLVPGLKRSKSGAARVIDIRFDVQYRLGRFIAKRVGVASPHPRRVIYPGYVDYFLGVGGVVVRPEFFDAEVFNIPRVAWVADDIWLSAQLARRGIKIYSPFMLPFPIATESAGIDALTDYTDNESDCRRASEDSVKLCRAEYGIWR
jgi:hypothetical protein